LNPNEHMRLTLNVITGSRHLKSKIDQAGTET